MEKDFYLDERWLASYFEKDWFDHVIKDEARPEFAFPEFDPLYLYCDYHEKLVTFLGQELRRIQFEPKGLLEIGSSLGRTFFEVCNKIGSIQAATLVEPSNLLASSFKKLFIKDDDGLFPIIKGNQEELDHIKFDSRHIKSACSRVDVSLTELPFQKLALNPNKFDLVICSNVLDQCQDTAELLTLLQKTTAPGGILALSCTYQWQEKYLGCLKNQITDIDRLFPGDWVRLNETNIPFKCRKSERLWMSFLSHVSILRKKQ